MISARALALLVLLALLAFPENPARAATDKLHVVFTEWFPYTHLRHGQASGFEIEVLKAVAETMGLETEFSIYPWKRCLLALQNGEADLLVSLLRTQEREEYTHFPDEHISLSKTVFFTRADRVLEFGGSYHNLKGYVIGVVAGFSYGEAFDHAEGLVKEEVGDAKLLIRKVVKGRNDLAAENQAVISAVARRMGLADQLRFLEPPIHTQKLYVGFSRANGLEQLCRRFSEALARFKQTEQYRAIASKYDAEFPGMAD